MTYSFQELLLSIALTIYYKKGGWMKRRRIVDR